ncbi:MAG: N-ATPase subunit AtpR [Gammaproteobacteria bacterium]
MNDNLMWVLAFGAGGMLGAFFFGGLWWTVHRGLKSKRPALWFIGSMLIRSGITLAGFYGVAADQWQRLLACLAGFIVARFIVVRLTRSWPIKTPEPVEE